MALRAVIAVSRWKMRMAFVFLGQLATIERLNLPLDDKYWTGATKLNTDGIWSWSGDGPSYRRSELTEWAMTNLINPTAETGDCAYFVPSRRRVQVRSCKEEHHVVCQRKIHELCSPGYEQRGSMCLHYSFDKANHYRAARRCEQAGGQLAEPRDGPLNNHLVSRLMSELPAAKLWLNVLGSEQTGELVYDSDSAPVPAHLSDAKRKNGCVYIDGGRNGLWVAGDCSEELQYVCVHKSRDFCPAGYEGFGSSSECFRFSAEKVPMNRARQRCGLNGGRLASLRSPATRDSIGRFIAAYMDSPFLIDLVDWSSPGTYYYLEDGTTAEWLDWAPNEPSAPGGNCTLVGGSDVNHRFISRPCSSGFHYICKYRSDIRCPAGFLRHGSGCFGFSTTKARIGFANVTCRRHGAALAALPDNATATFFSKFRSGPTGGGPWLLGVTRDPSVGDWRGPDGQIAPYLPWGPRQGNRLDERCAIFPYGPSGTRFLADVRCTRPFGFICEREEDPAEPADQEVFGDCFRERDPFLPDFNISPSDYHPQKVSPLSCRYRCLALGFRYAGLKSGQSCFCSPFLRSAMWRSAAACPDPLPCPEGPSESHCGSTSFEYLNVYTSGDIPAARGTEVTVSPADVVKGGSNVTFIASFLEGSDVNYSFDSGAGFALPTAQRTFFTKMHVAGHYVITVQFTDKLNITTPVLSNKSLHVLEPVLATRLDCPEVVKPGQRFSCGVTAYGGSDRNLTLDRGDGSPAETFLLPDATSVLLGTAPPLALGPDAQDITIMFSTVIPSSGIRDSVPAMTVNSTGATASDVTTTPRPDVATSPPYVTTIRPPNVTITSPPEVSTLPPEMPAGIVLMPWAPAPSSASVVAVETFSLTEGVLQVLVMRPDDSTSPSASAPPDGACETAACNASRAMPTTFSVAEPIDITVSVGHNYVTVDPVSLLAGDVIGYRVGGPKVAATPFKDGADSLLSDWGASNDRAELGRTAGPTGTRSFLRAVVAEPVSLTVDLTYDAIGCFRLAADVIGNGSESAVRAEYMVNVQIPIRWPSAAPASFEPPNVVRNAEVNVSLAFRAGSNVTITYHWGDGGQQEHNEPGDLGGVSRSMTKRYTRAAVYSLLVVAENLWGSRRFEHVLHCQHPVLPDLWTVWDSSPVLWPVPGDVNFTVMYPAGQELPTAASLSLSFGDGYDIGPLRLPEGRGGYAASSNRTYASAGDYVAELFIWNLVSNITLEYRVKLFAEIKNLTSKPKFLPFLPIGGTEYKPGFGPEQNNFPLERNVSFFVNKTQGTVFYYIAELDDGTFLANSSRQPVDVLFSETGVYSLSIYGWNPLQGRSEPTNFTVVMVESVIGVEIDDYNMVSEAGSVKELEIRFSSVGTYSCLMFRYGDGTITQGFSDTGLGKEACDDWARQEQITYMWKGPFTNPLQLKDHVYRKKGYYQMYAIGFNFLSQSSHSLNVPVTSVPCSPPLLWIKNNNTRFWQPQEVLRSRPVTLVTVCTLDCDMKLVTTKTWTCEKIDESWGRELGAQDISELDSRNKSILFVPERFLEYGTYRFSYTLAIAGDPRAPLDPTTPFERLVSTYVRIVRSPLEVKLLEGGVASIVRGFDQTVELSPALLSGDPDYPQHTDFLWQWFCRRFPDEVLPTDRRGFYVYEPEMVSNPILNASIELYEWIYDNVTNTSYEAETQDYGGCFGLGPGPINFTDGLLLLNTRQLRAINVTYELAVVMRKRLPDGSLDPRRGMSSVFVRVVPGSPPVLEVRCQKVRMCIPTERGAIINPSRRLALLGQCLAFCSGRLSWSWRVFLYSNGVETRLQGDQRYIIGGNRPVMALLKRIFSDHPDILEFHIKLSVSRLGGEEGQTEMFLLINQPPSGGSCRLYPPRGRVMGKRAAAIDADPPTMRKRKQNLDNDNTTASTATEHDSTDGGSSRPSEPGRALTEDWTVKCRRFRDPDGQRIAKYSFYLKHLKYSYVKNMKCGAERKAKLVFPYGRWELRVSIYDTMGAMNDISIAKFSTSLPTKGERARWELKGDIGRAMGEGDQSRLTQLLQSRASVDKHPLPDDPDQPTTPAAATEDELAAPRTLSPEEEQALLAEQQRRQDEELTRRAEEAKLMLMSLGSFNTDTLDDCTQMLSTVAAVVGDDEAIDSSGKDLAISAVGGKCLQNIMSTSLNDPAEADTFVSNSMQTLSSLVKGISGTLLDGKVLPSDRAPTATEDPLASPVDAEEAAAVAAAAQVSYASDQVSRMLQSVEALQKKLLELVFPGEPAVTIATEDGLEMTLVMMEAAELSDFQIWQGGGLYTFPDICAILHQPRQDGNCSAAQNRTVAVQAVAWPSILQSYGAGARQLLGADTRTMQLQLVDVTPERSLVPLPVTDLEPQHEVLIVIPRGGHDEAVPAMPPPSLVVPRPEPSQKPMMYHVFNVTNPFSSVNIEITLSNPYTQMALFIRRALRPSLVLWDEVVELSTVLRVKNVSQPLLDPPDPWGNLTDGPGTYPQYDVFLNDRITGNYTGPMYLGVAELANFTDEESFWESPESVNMTWTNISRVFSSNYTVRIFTSGCLFFDAATESWSSEGCRVLDANHRSTTCSCNHLTSFGSGFFTQPNSIDFDYVFANAGFENNLTIYVTIIVTVAVYLILVFWARWKDKKDVEKIGCTPLLDNNPEHKYLYEILVFTGHQEEAQTDSRVQLIVSGDRDETDVRTLTPGGGGRGLARGATDSFVMAVPRPLGRLNYLRVWHDNSGHDAAASWYLSVIVMRDVQTGEKFQFIANRWFAVERDDGQIDRLLPVAGREQMLDFQHLFNTTSRKNLSDGHLWFSVFMRPPRSRFTRVQRVSACMALLYLSMLVNAMWYGLVPDEPGSSAFSFGPFSFSPEQLGVGVMANLIVFPPSFLIVLLFRKSRPRHPRENRVEKAVSEQRAQQRAATKGGGRRDGDLDNSKDGDSLTTATTDRGKAVVDKKIQRKKSFSLPWWCAIIAWILVVVSMGASIFFLWAYGITFGNEKTTKWLTALVISFFSSLLFTQPLKVLLTAMLVSAVCKKLDNDHDDIDDDEKQPELEQDEEWLSPPHRPKKRSRRLQYKPPDAAFLERAKEQRRKEVAMWAILKEVLAYAFFLWVLLALSYGNRAPSSFLMRDALSRAFGRPDAAWLDFGRVGNASRFYYWAREVLVPQLVAGEDYSGRPPAKSERRLLQDRVSLLLGHATLRQVRVRERTCRVPKAMRWLTNHCRGKSAIFDEERRDFGRGWNASLAAVRPHNLAEYRYRSALELDGVPYWGSIGWYSPGGYVLELRGSRSLLVEAISRLEADRWLDARTRAVFVEFSVYNAQVNLFASCQLLVEQSPDGGMLPSMKITPLRLVRYHQGFGLFVLVCEAVFIAFIIYYTYKEIKDMRRQRMAYWSDPWNYLELIVVGLGHATIVFYGIRSILGMRIVDEFASTQGSGYINLQYAASVDEVFGYLCSFLVFFATLKFIKLLRFNKRMGLLTSTLKQCAADMSGFAACFLLIFLAFAQCFYLLLNAEHIDYSNFMITVEAMFSAMLGKFDYAGISQGSRVLGPIVFFVFALSTTLILVNILLTLVIVSFHQIKEDIQKQSNEYEIVDFMVQKIKAFTGVGKSQNIVSPEPVKEPTEEFPDKVNQLLEHINVFYFEGHLDLNNKSWIKKVHDDKDKADSAEQEKKQQQPAEC